jgi:hypothetical protein
MSYQSGCRDPICLRWLTGIYFALGLIPQAEKMLKEWLSAEPYSLEARDIRKQIEERKPVTETSHVRVDAAPSLPKPVGIISSVTAK